MLVRKIDPNWVPAENPDLAVGETIEMDNVEQLLGDGQVELVDGDSTADETPEEVVETPAEEVTETPEETPVEEAPATPEEETEATPA